MYLLRIAVLAGRVLPFPDQHRKNGQLLLRNAAPKE